MSPTCNKCGAGMTVAKNATLADVKAGSQWVCPTCHTSKAATMQSASRAKKVKRLFAIGVLVVVVVVVAAVAVGVATQGPTKQLGGLNDPATLANAIEASGNNAAGVDKPMVNVVCNHEVGHIFTCRGDTPDNTVQTITVTVSDDGISWNVN